MVTTAVVGSIVGQEAITEVSKGIFQSVTGIFYHTNPIVKELLEELDTYDEVELVKTLIMEINKQTLNDSKLDIDIEEFMISQNYNIIDGNDAMETVEQINKEANKLDETKEVFPSVYCEEQPFISETLTKCLYQLKDIVEKIYKEINELNKGIEFHKTLWFQSFRAPKYLLNLEKIKKYQKIMNAKFEHLVKLMNIYLRLDYKLFQQETEGIKTIKTKPYFSQNLTTSVYADNELKKINNYMKESVSKIPTLSKIDE